MSVNTEARTAFLKSTYLKNIQGDTFKIENGIIICEETGETWAISACGEYKVPKNYKQFRMSYDKARTSTYVACIDMETDEMWVLPAEIFREMSSLVSGNAAFSFNIMNKGLATDSFRPDRSNYFSREEVCQFVEELNPYGLGDLIAKNLKEEKKNPTKNAAALEWEARKEKAELSQKTFTRCEVFLELIDGMLKENGMKEEGLYRKHIALIRDMNKQALGMAANRLSSVKEKIAENGYVEV